MTYATSLPSGSYFCYALRMFLREDYDLMIDNLRRLLEGEVSDSASFWLLPANELLYQDEAGNIDYSIDERTVALKDQIRWWKQEASSCGQGSNTN